MKNYYEILGIRRNSSLQTIKNTFRNKAKLFHPDVTRKSKMVAEEAMRQLLLAYRVLSNPAKRSAYDRELRGAEKKVSFNYREFLKSRTDDLFLQSKLVLYDFLRGNTDEAVKLYEHLSDQDNFMLEKYLDYGDFMDCSFLIAEEYENHREYLKAFLLYRKIYSYELKRPYFRHFTDELIDRLRHLVTTKLQKAVALERFIVHIKDLLGMSFPERDKAVFCKKIAELYLLQDERERAMVFLKQGLEYDKRLPGTKKLSEKIGFAELAN
ncbi:MAG: J domain-containing protein [Spirochaetales bacterium]|nr:J domain-containing protein [Spirochaetales bacterium]